MNDNPSPEQIVADTSSDDIVKSNQFKQKKQINKIILICGIIFLLLVIAIVCIMFVPRLQKTVDDYLAVGDYSKAYHVAKTDEEKSGVIRENTIAVCSALCLDVLKDSESFCLRDGWYDGEKNAVIKVSANNSFGNTVVNYVLLFYDDSSCSWTIFDSYADLNNEKIASYDDIAKRFEKGVHNLGLLTIKETMLSQNKIDKYGIDRINNIYKENALENIKLCIEAIP